MSPSAPSRPSSTYRLQLSPSFRFPDAAAIVDYLAALGVTHVYCSPVLQARPGSQHGYDVVDHSRLNAELGGGAGFAELTRRLRDAGMGAVVDVVPNHMGLPAPESLNAAFWDLLRHGRESAHAAWFDVDWSSPACPGKVLVPVLGSPVGEAVANGELTVEGSGHDARLRYYDHAFPLAAGTVALADDLPALLAAQHYRLAFWRVCAEELNWRRFFDISELIALRVEDPEVFDATHARLLALVRAGEVTGLRIDHPDGLADPGGYLRRLADATGGAWVVVEKILEGAEALPSDWACAGTTGYDAILRVGGLFVDPAGEASLTALYSGVTGSTSDFASVVEESKRLIVSEVLAAEVNRLTDLLVRITRSDLALADHTRRALREALAELLVAVPVYRAYICVTEPAPDSAVDVLTAAAARAGQRLPQRAAEIERVRDLALGRRGRSADKDEFVVRFQQTTGMLMAKGVEDTAFYRWFRFAPLNEVGGDPERFGVALPEFSDWCSTVARTWPGTMTTLSTHDAKRSEDVRARLAVLSELPREWGEAVTSWQAAATQHRSPDGWPDANTQYLFWQTLVGAWPLSLERARSYLEKAAREAKRHTSWTDRNDAYDAALQAWVERVYGDDAVMSSVAAFVAQVRRFGRVNSIAQKLVQLTIPGVADVYQGTEGEALSLVDPDNRRPVDYDGHRRRLARLDAGELPDVDASFDAAKLLVTSRALRLRRELPSVFAGTYQPLPASGAAAGHVVGFVRGDSVATVVPRLVVGLERGGGWGDTTVELPRGDWKDVLSGSQWPGGGVPVAELLARFPAALLRRARETS